MVDIVAGKELYRAFKSAVELERHYGPWRRHTVELSLELADDLIAYFDELEAKNEQRHTIPTD